MLTSQGACRILIVDDSQAVRESLGWLLRDESNLTVVGEAANGSDAIRLALKLKPDVVILDIELPDTDGFFVTQELKKMSEPPLVVLLSIHGDIISKQRGVLAGCDVFVEKGTSWPNLLAILQKL